MDAMTCLVYKMTLGVSAMKRDVHTFFRYFPVSERDRRWGLYLTTAGESRIPPGFEYPPAGHPGAYQFISLVEIKGNQENGPIFQPAGIPACGLQRSLIETCQPNVDGQRKLK